MITRIPNWVFFFAWFLAFMAGIINVVGFLSFEQQAITHLTGTTSLLSAAIASGKSQLALHLLAIVLSFIVGAAISGFIIRDNALQLGRRYGVVLLMEAAVLLVAVMFLEQQSAWGIYLAGAACGLQNAMATTYTGTVIRTSHVTGMFTDLGIFLGHALRGISVEVRRLKISLIVISGFFIGGIAGAALFGLWHFNVLYVPAAMALVMAAANAYYRKRSSELNS